MKIFLGILILLAVLCIPFVAQPAYASHPCPVCGNLVGYGGQITWQTWETNGFQHSGWILCCDHCGYTTCRDANGQVPDPYLANKAWQGKMFPWIYNGWAHAQSLGQ
ncbi:transposase [Candidatus Bathyarchaeota archaeon]|nr:transposase [Candidatus Bathyarchaeota archaeon]